MTNPWDWKNRPSIFANDKNFNGGNAKKKTSYSANSSVNDNPEDKKKLHLVTNHTKRKFNSKDLP